MDTETTSELIYGQNIYVPATANYYPYGYTGVRAPVKWYDHQTSLGYDGQDIYYPAEGSHCIYYATPDNGSVHSSYSSYPLDQSFLVDGPLFGVPEYAADAVNPTSHPIVPSPYYVQAALPYAPDRDLSSTAPPFPHPNAAFLPSRLCQAAATATEHLLPSYGPVTLKTDVALNPPMQATVVSSKQFQDHPELPKVQSHNSVPLKQQLADRAMVSVKHPRASQASDHLLHGAVSTVKHSPQSNLSGNNCFGYIGSDLCKWASAEKFQPSSKSSSHLNGVSQKVHLSSEHGLGNTEKPSGRRPSALIVKSYTSKFSIGNAEGTMLIRTDQYNRDNFRVVYPQAKFFVIKSIGEADVHKSIKYGVWSSSSSGNSKLDSAYEDAQRIATRNSTECPVFLFFSVNGSGHFCGLAEMIGRVDFHKDMDFWCQDKWTGSFPVRWHIIKDIPNHTLQHILLQNNENKPVTYSRDTQEIPYAPGTTMLKIFKGIRVKECLFDDFMAYEEDEARSKQFRRSKLSHNAPDFIPVSHRGHNASDAKQPKSDSVLRERIMVMQNMTDKISNVSKYQDACLEAAEKRISEVGKENAQGNEQVVKTATNQPPTITVKAGVDGKQYWKKVEVPRQHHDSATHISPEAHEKHLNGVLSSSVSIVAGTPKVSCEKQAIIDKVGALAISSQISEADYMGCSVDVVTVGSMPIRLKKSDA